MLPNTALEKRDLFREATVRICGSLDLGEALLRLFDYIKDIVPATGITLGMYDTESSVSHIIAEATSDGIKTVPMHFNFPDQYKDEISNRWNRDDPFIFFDPAKAKPWEKKMVASVWPVDCHLVVMKLFVGSERIGALGIYTPSGIRITDEQLQLVSLMNEPAAIALSNALKHQELLRMKELLVDDNRSLREQLLRMSGDAIVGKDGGLAGVMEMVRQVGGMDSPVLLLGETGAGKEMIANALHLASDRREYPFIKINCGAIPDTLIDSELFGHEKGAFTGAVTQKRGCFERAHKGSILLDEIGELPLAAQIRLLRVLQTKEITRVGGTSSVPVDVRIICATHRNLEEMVKAGRFRADLWFRIHVFPILIPPLRHRKEDIPALLRYFLEKKSTELKIYSPPVLAPGAVEKCMKYHWPGNVRELENIVERSLILAQTGGKTQPIRFDNVVLEPDPERSKPGGTEYFPDNFPDLEGGIRYLIQQALHVSRGKVEGPFGAAELLKINPNTLRSKMRKLGIPYGRRASS
jgi:transcriptional regulator with GAF, ATPase, and Fis domain